MSPILKNLIDQAAAAGYPAARLRDAAFAVLATAIKDNKTAYAVLFPSENPDNAKMYAAEPLIAMLCRQAKSILQPPAPEPMPKKRQKTQEELSFDENKAAMLRMLKEIEEEKKREDADIPKLLKIEADIRVKLNDKFEVTTSAEEQLIIVQPKFNHICEHTGRECFLQTKEFAMQHWHLIEAK